MNERNNKIDDAYRFPAFLDILLEQKRIIEYESADIKMRRMGVSGPTYHLENQGEEREEGPEINAKTPRCLLHGSNTHTTAT